LTVEENDLEVFNFLASQGADSSIKNDYGKAPLNVDE